MTAAELITDHAWRPPNSSTTAESGPLLERPCVYMACGRPRSEHARTVIAGVQEDTGDEWIRYRKCPVCYALLGRPCTKLSGARTQEADRPHSTRKLRTEAARTGGDR